LNLAFAFSGQGMCRVEIVVRRKAQVKQKKVLSHSLNS
jgi:hypothetical protein